MITEKKYRCRFCGDAYAAGKSSAIWKGYCTRKCEDRKATALGWRKSQGNSSHFDVLNKGKAIGHVLELAHD